MNQTAGELSGWQLTAILVIVIMGHRVITISRTATAAAGEAGWMTVPLAASVAAIGIVAGARLGSRFPGWSLARICRHLLGAPVGAITCLALAAYWILQAALSAREFADIVAVTALFNTPLLVTVLLLFSAAAYLVSCPVRVLGRVNELYWAYIALAVVGGGVAGLTYMRAVHLLPWYGRGLPGLITGTAVTFYDFGGFSTALAFYPFLLRPKAGVIAGLKAIAIAGFVFVTLVFAGTVVLGVDALQTFVWPTLELVKLSRVPGALLERLDAAFISVGVAAIFSTVSVYLYAAVLVAGDTFSLRRRLPVICALAGLGVVAAMLPPDVQSLFATWRRADSCLWVVGLGLPVALLLLSHLRRHPRAMVGS